MAPPLELNTLPRPRTIMWLLWLVLAGGGHDWVLPDSAASDLCPEASRARIETLYHRAARHHPATCDTIVRVGPPGDGGKLICADRLPVGHCVVYSLGSRLDFSFEAAIVRQFNCDVHTFDCTVGVPKPSAVPHGVGFHPWCVGARDELAPMSSDLGHQGEIGTYYTLSTIQRKLGHRRVDVLKMDIERHEFAVVQSLSSRAAPLQLAFETHLHNAYGVWGGPVARKQWLGLWSKLQRLGYGVFSYELNPLCLCCCEFSVVSHL